MRNGKLLFSVFSFLCFAVPALLPVSLGPT
jgi:hypothetical protein